MTIDNKSILNLLKKYDLIFDKPIGLVSSDGYLIYSKQKIHDERELAKIYSNAYQNKILQIECNLFRYYYFCKNSTSNGKHATVIMINPAFADSKKDDPTITNIKKYLFDDNKFSSFEILNLYPIRMPKSTKLKDLLSLTEDETKKYQKFLKDYLINYCKNNVIIAAWGADKEDNDVAQDLFRDCNMKFYCYGYSKEGYPKHFSPQSFNKPNKSTSPIPYIGINNWLNRDDLNEYDLGQINVAKEIKDFICTTKGCDNTKLFMQTAYIKLFDSLN